ncbi:MAG: GIY-YIG nuclease family protein [bacterium]|nr:GIY-YIG nuclease family protein [bacterium]
MSDVFYYVYILQSLKDKNLYIGFTDDLKSRFLRHQKGQVPATAPRLPLKLIFYESYRNKYDALRREKYLKSTKGKTTLKSMLREYLSQESLNH